MRHERVIRNRRVEPDAWTCLGLGGEPVPAVFPAGPVILPLAAWLETREKPRTHAAPVGVWLGPGDDPAALAPDLATLPLVAVFFPRFADGRGYSTAFLLRTRLGYRGELRAIGDVGRDQLFALARVGFDAFVLPPHRDPEAALASFRDFGVVYQASADSPLPLFRRRLAAGSPAPEASHG